MTTEEKAASQRRTSITLRGSILEERQYSWATRLMWGEDASLFFRFESKMPSWAGHGHPGRSTELPRQHDHRDTHKQDAEARNDRNRKWEKQSGHIERLFERQNECSYGLLGSPRRGQDGGKTRLYRNEKLPFLSTWKITFIKVKTAGCKHPGGG